MGELEAAKGRVLMTPELERALKLIGTLAACRGWIWWVKWVTIPQLLKNCPHHSEEMSRGNETLLTVPTH